MPELPEVESARRQLADRLVGQKVRRVEACPQRRFVDPHRAEGRRIEALERRGKYLLAPLSGGVELVVHLGMSGSLRVRGEGGWQPDAHVRATLHLDRLVVDFRDVRRFGRIAVLDRGDHSVVPMLAALGPEPLDGAFTAAGLHAALRASRSPVKAVLLGQRAVAGLGNIYADEALWRAGIHPAARRVGAERAERLHAAIRQVLAEAIERQGTTLRDHRLADGSDGAQRAHLDVYGRAGQPCRRCGTVLVGLQVAGRTTVRCPACQQR